MTLENPLCVVPPNKLAPFSDGGGAPVFVANSEAPNPVGFVVRPLFCVVFPSPPPKFVVGPVL